MNTSNNLPRHRTLSLQYFYAYIASCAHLEATDFSASNHHPYDENYADQQIMQADNGQMADPRNLTRLNNTFRVFLLRQQ